MRFFLHFPITVCNVDGVQTPILIMVCTITCACVVSTKDVHLLLNHRVHAVPPTWHHPPSNRPPLSTLPSFSQVSNLKLANSKLGSGQLANHFPPCPTSRSLTRDHFRLHTQQIRLQKTLLTSQMRRTANPGDPV